MKITAHVFWRQLRDGLPLPRAWWDWYDERTIAACVMVGPKHGDVLASVQIELRLPEWALELLGALS